MDKVSKQGEELALLLHVYIYHQNASSLVCHSEQGLCCQTLYFMSNFKIAWTNLRACWIILFLWSSGR